MFRRRTLFIVGAGASAEVGLPVGKGLGAMIADLVRPKIDAVQRRLLDSPDRTVQAALKHIPRHYSDVSHAMVVDACEAIADAMPATHSIDTFIDIHSTNPAIAICGKLAIAAKILTEERRSTLHVSPANQFNRLNLRVPSAVTHGPEPWFTHLMSMLSAGTKAEQPELALEPLSFIVFNYDRCIEHYLQQAVSAVYRVSSDEATRLVSQMQIIHPYGQVGRLPGFGPGEPVRFGEDYNGNPDLLHRIAKSLRTFTEQYEDDQDLIKIRRAIQEAKMIVFLGFGFIHDNMELLAVPKPIGATSVLATGYGMSDEDQRAVFDAVRRAFFTGSPLQPSDNQIVVAGGKGCADLFQGYSRAIPGIPTKYRSRLSGPGAPG